MGKKSRKTGKSFASTKREESSSQKQNLGDRDVQTRRSFLTGKKLAFAIGGGIGATEAVKISRELRRQGAEVQAFLSPEAERFITSLSVEWATLRKPVCKVGPQVEYLEKFDGVVVCPATLNTISKAALALADTGVDLLIANTLGSKTPLFMVPTMNFEMWKNPILKKHLNQLKDLGVFFFPEEVDEDRLKVPDSSRLVAWIIKEWEKR